AGAYGPSATAVRDQAMDKLTPHGRQPAGPEGSRYPNPTRPPQRRAPEPQQSLLLVGLMYGGIGLLALGVAAVTFLLISPPADFMRNRIVSEVRAETGREFKIAGPASFTFFPSVGMRMSDVSLSAPPGMGGEPLLTAQSLDVGVRLWPLLRREIVVDQLVLHKPVFNLRVDAQGKRSWDLGAIAAPVRYAEAATTVTDDPIGRQQRRQRRPRSRLGRAVARRRPHRRRHRALRRRAVRRGTRNHGDRRRGAGSLACEPRRRKGRLPIAKREDHLRRQDHLA